MFISREQENLIHSHHQIAASKPLNQGTRGLQPKTPGNNFPKTPLKVALNDGSVIGANGKGQENMVTGGKKVTLDKNAFVTPMGKQ